MKVMSRQNKRMPGLQAVISKVVHSIPGLLLRKHEVRKLTAPNLNALKCAASLSFPVYYLER